MAISPTLRTAMFDEETLDGLLVALTIDHTSLAVPIRVVNNEENIHVHNTTNSLADESPNANIAVLTGSPTFVTGINAVASGKALLFTAAQSADFSAGTEFDVPSFTLELWIDPTTLPGGGGDVDSNAVLGRNDTGISGFRIGYNEDGRVHFDATTDGGTLDINTGATVLVVGTPTHCAFTWDNATGVGRILFNGATVVTSAVSQTLVQPTGRNLFLNKHGGTNGDATYDELRFWDFAKNDAQVLRLLNRRSLGAESGLLGYWPWSGNDIFVGLPFRISLPTDEAGSPPSSQLVIDNVSQEMVTAIRNATGSPPTVDIQVVRILDQNAQELTFPSLSLRNARADVSQVSGDLFSEDLQTEPYPADVFTPGYFPGLF